MWAVPPCPKQPLWVPSGGHTNVTVFLMACEVRGLGRPTPKRIEEAGAGMDSTFLPRRMESGRAAGMSSVDGGRKGMRPVTEP